MCFFVDVHPYLSIYLDNFDEGQRRIARFSEGSVLLSSELSDESSESAEECENSTKDR
jgi:hypothetical protein